jgi:hypothetical protein
MYEEEPWRSYWSVLFPEFAAPGSTMHWYGKWKTAQTCMGIFGERQQARHEWISSGPRRGRTESHTTAIVTYHASPLSSQTLRVCVSCLWISRNLNEEHPS